MTHSFTPARIASSISAGSSCDDDEQHACRRMLPLELRDGRWQPARSRRSTTSTSGCCAPDCASAESASRDMTAHGIPVSRRSCASCGSAPTSLITADNVSPHRTRMIVRRNDALAGNGDVPVARAGIVMMRPITAFPPAFKRHRTGVRVDVTHAFDEIPVDV